MKHLLFLVVFLSSVLLIAAEPPTVTLMIVTSYPNKKATSAPGQWIKDLHGNLLFHHVNDQKLVFRKFKKVVYSKPPVPLEIDLPDGTRMETSNVIFHLYPDDAKRFHELTKKNQGKQVACFIGEKFFCAPVILTPIPDGCFEISGGFTEKDLKAVQELIKAAEKTQNKEKIISNQ